MTFEERTDWVDAPRPPAKPGETPVKTVDIKRWERGIAEAHEALDGRLSEAGLNATYARRDEMSGGEAYPPVVYSVSADQPVFPDSTIACFGDSLTQSNGTDWPSLVATLTGRTVVNRGVSGQGAADIILRQGGLQPRLTLAFGEIPAGLTPVSVTSVDPVDGWRVGGTGSFGFGGYLAGVRGTLTHNLVDGSWSFTRTEAGSATPVPAGTPFVGVETARNPASHLVLWAGRNNAGTLPAVRDLIGLAIERGIETQVRRYLIIGVTNGTNEGKAHATYAKIVEHNKLLRARYGKFFFDIRREFIDRGLALAGITPTQADLDAIADDRPPASLMADTLHPNAAGYQVVGQLVAEKILELGWVASLSGGPAAPSVSPTVTVGTPGSTSQQLSWAAVADATSYKVEYRKQGDTAWSTGPSVTGTSATVTSLASATAYEFRVAAVNGSGTGPWSATVSGTTANAATLLTSDSFNRANTAAGTLGTSDAAFGGTPAAWTVDSQIAIVDNQVGGAVTNTRLAHCDVGVTDHYVEAVLAATTEGGVIARFTDAGNYYTARGTATGQLALDARAAAATTNLETTATGFLSVGDRIGLLVRGTDITVFRNGVQVLYRSDNRVTTGTRTGLRSSFSNAAYRLDNFRVATDVLTAAATA
ncbi:hypothetical protein GS491_19170 [Rhodococcus hoagii]|nr:hypothetical protein [Prescottella equi]NKT01808.1 hypothetical protein [Prescottella equi]NKT01861.1 hypothetical protein [Prescottella equi]